MIMPKNQFKLPTYTFDVQLGSELKSFNISGEYFEYMVYVKPDTFTGGSYAVIAWIEEIYK